MKHLYGVWAIVMFVGTVFMCPVKADGVQYIDGTVTDADTSEALEDIEVAMTNVRTLETIYDLTDEEGYFYKALTSFTQGWQNGDWVDILIIAEGYKEYFSSYVLSSSWCVALSLEIDLVIDEYDENVQYPYVDYTTQWQLTCVGAAQTLGADIAWAHPDNGIVTVPDADPDYDGVEIQGGLMVQDDGDWVTPGQTWTVYASYYMKIQKSDLSYTYYENTLYLYHNGQYYYQITSDGFIAIDPMHDIKIPKLSINNIPIKITATLTWSWYEGETYLDGDNHSETQTMKYVWA